MSSSLQSLIPFDHHEQQHPTLLPHLGDTIHQALTYSNDSAIINRFTGALVVYAVSFPPFLVFGLVVSALLIVRWKQMVPIKRALFGLVVLISLLQLVSIIGGIMYSVCLLATNDKYCMDPFAMIQYVCGNATIILCAYCFMVITRILYKVYFDKSQWWMRGRNKDDEQQQQQLQEIPNTSNGGAVQTGTTEEKETLQTTPQNWVSHATAKRNQRFGLFVKYTALTCAIVLGVVAPLHLITIAITSLTSLMPGVTQARAKSIGMTRYYVDSAFALSYWGLIFFFGILNIVIGVSLTKKFIGTDNKIPLHRRKACRQLILLNVLQLIFGGVTGSLVIMAILTLVEYEFYIAGITLQRISIFCFAIALTFIYGPLDDLDVIKKTGANIRNVVTTKIIPANLNHGSGSGSGSGSKGQLMDASSRKKFTSVKLDNPSVSATVVVVDPQSPASTTSSTVPLVATTTITTSTTTSTQNIEMKQVVEPSASSSSPQSTTSSSNSGDHSQQQQHASPSQIIITTTNEEVPNQSFQNSNELDNVV